MITITRWQIIIIIITRSYAAAADLDWIVGPGYSLSGYILGCSQRLASYLWHSAQIGPDRLCHPSSVIPRQSSVIHLPASVIRHPLSVVSGPSSSSVICHPLYVIHLPSSVICHPSSNIRHPSSVIHHRSSVIENIGWWGNVTNRQKDKCHISIMYRLS